MVRCCILLPGQLRAPALSVRPSLSSTVSSRSHWTPTAGPSALPRGRFPPMLLPCPVRVEIMLLPAPIRGLAFLALARGRLQRPNAMGAALALTRQCRVSATHYLAAARAGILARASGSMSCIGYVASGVVVSVLYRDFATVFLSARPERPI